MEDIVSEPLIGVLEPYNSAQLRPDIFAAHGESHGKLAEARKRPQIQPVVYWKAVYPIKAIVSGVPGMPASAPNRQQQAGKAPANQSIDQ